MCVALKAQFHTITAALRCSELRYKFRLGMMQATMKGSSKVLVVVPFPLQS